MIERRDLYNINREKTGLTIYKDDMIPDNYYILIVVIIIENNKNEFLIQKRSANKGSLYGLTGGHPKSGESSFDGIICEFKEELGLDINNPILFKQAIGKNTLCDLYYIKKDIDIKDIVLQKEEVDSVEWMSIEKINQLYNNKEFKKGHYLMFKDYLKFKKKSQNK